VADLAEDLTLESQARAFSRQIELQRYATEPGAPPVTIAGAQREEEDGSLGGNHLGDHLGAYPDPDVLLLPGADADADAAGATGAVPPAPGSYGAPSYSEFAADDIDAELDAIIAAGNAAAAAEEEGDDEGDAVSGAHGFDPADLDGVDLELPVPAAVGDPALKAGDDGASGASGAVGFLDEADLPSLTPAGVGPPAEDAAAMQLAALMLKKRPDWLRPEVEDGVGHLHGAVPGEFVVHAHGTKLSMLGNEREVTTLHINYDSATRVASVSDTPPAPGDEFNLDAATDAEWHAHISALLTMVESHMADARQSPLVPHMLPQMEVSYNIDDEDLGDSSTFGL